MKKTGNWCGFYKACQNVIKNNTDVKSTMIYGCQWDETMEWLKNTMFKGQEDKVDTDSSYWGNYSGSPTETGNESYKANEIYDLAGNYYDSTQEAASTICRIRRGGYYGDSSSSVPASDRYYHNEYIDYGRYSARVTLYIL